MGVGMLGDAKNSTCFVLALGRSVCRSSNSAARSRRLRSYADVLAHVGRKAYPHAPLTCRLFARRPKAGYGADSSTFAEPGAGEILIDRAIVQLLKFQGRLKPVPDLRY
jgi:hypothetical protein